MGIERKQGRYPLSSKKRGSASSKDQKPMPSYLVDQLHKQALSDKVNATLFMTYFTEFVSVRLGGIGKDNCMRQLQEYEEAMDAILTEIAESKLGLEQYHGLWKKLEYHKAKLIGYMNGVLTAL